MTSEYRGYVPPEAIKPEKKPVLNWIKRGGKYISVLAGGLALYGLAHTFNGDKDTKGVIDEAAQSAGKPTKPDTDQPIREKQDRSSGKKAAIKDGSATNDNLDAQIDESEREASWQQYVDNKIEIANKLYPDLAKFFKERLPNYDFAVEEVGGDDNRLEVYSTTGNENGGMKYLFEMRVEKGIDGETTYTVEAATDGYDSEANVGIAELAKTIDQKHGLHKAAEQLSKNQMSEEEFRKYLRDHNIAQPVKLGEEHGQ